MQSSSTNVPNQSSLNFLYTFNDDTVTRSVSHQLLSFTEFNVAKFVSICVSHDGCFVNKNQYEQLQYALFHSPSQFKLKHKIKGLSLKELKLWSTIFLLFSLSVPWSKNWNAVWEIEHFHLKCCCLGQCCRSCSRQVVLSLCVVVDV